MLGRRQIAAIVRALGHLRASKRRPPRQLQPDQVRLEYWKAIVTAVLDPAREVVERVIRRAVAPLLEQARAQRADAGGRRAADVVDEVAQAFKENLDVEALRQMARRFGEETTDFQREQLKRQTVALLGVDPGLDAPTRDALDDFAAHNANLIKSIPSQYLDQVQERVTDAVMRGRRWEDLADDLEDRYNVARDRARLIARDQVGKLYGQVQQLRQRALGADGYVWRTMQDQRVRDEHADREGQRFSWDDPPEDGHPGEPINCRCYAEPDFSSVLGDL